MIFCTDWMLPLEVADFVSFIAPEEKCPLEESHAPVMPDCVV